MDKTSRSRLFVAALSLHGIAANFRLSAVGMAITFALLALTRLLRQGNRLK